MVKLSLEEIELYKEKGFVVPNFKVSDDILGSSSRVISLSDNFIVTETGFPSNREPYNTHSGEHLVPTKEVLSYFRRRS